MSLLWNVGLEGYMGLIALTAWWRMLTALFVLPTVSQGNVVKGNAAAGSHRAGFRVVGPALSMEECAAGHPDAKADFDDNVAHSSLVGLLLEGSPGAPCTGVRRFAAWRNWDFGILAGLQGIGTSVLLEEVAAVDSRHAGILVLKKGRATEDHEANIIGGLIRASSPQTP